MPDGQARSLALKNRLFLSLWSAQAISQTAHNVLTFALLIEVGQMSRSSIQTSLIVLSFIVPGVLFGPIAGMFVDRFDKRKALLVTNLLLSGTVLAYIAVDPKWPVAIALLTIYLLSVAFSIISQFFLPIEAAIIPLLFAKEQLISANALFSAIFFSARLAGFALLGPLLVKVTTLHTIAVLVASLYLICALLVTFLPALPEATQLAKKENLDRGLRRSWKGVFQLWSLLTRERPVATAIIDLGITTSIFLMLGTLGVSLLTQVVGLSASDLAYLMVSSGIGALVGLTLFPRAFRHDGGRALAETGLVAMGTSMLGMASIYSASSIILGGFDLEFRIILTLVAIMPLAAGLGMGSAFVSVPAQTLLHEWSPISLHCRVFAALLTVTSALAILPVLFSGVMADLIGPQGVFSMVGLATLMLAASRLLSHRV